MALDGKEVEALLNGHLIIDFTEITLSRASSHSSRTYQGSGSIYQTENGEIELKLYHIFKSQSELYLEDYLFSSHEATPGKLFQDDEFFSLHGIDMKGREWSAKHILLDPSFSIPATGKVIVTTLSSIKNISSRMGDNSNPPSLTAIFEGQYDLPYNEYKKIGNSSSLSICNLNINDCTYSIHKLDNNLQINCSSGSGADVTKTFDLFLEAIQIGIGQVMRPYYLVFFHGDTCTTTIKTRRPKKELPEPIPIRTPWESKYLQTFITKYLGNFETPYNQYYGYWHRIVGAYSGTLENQTLVLTTAIEGILKAFYDQHGKPDDKFVEEISLAVPIIENLGIGVRAKNRIITTLNNAKDTTAKNALRNLEENKIVSNKMVKAWEKARNKAVHPIKHELNNNEVQKLLDDIGTCLRIFYALLMNTISYHGVYIDYSEEGWPRSDQ